jgi:hypothetical protein
MIGQRMLKRHGNTGKDRVSRAILQPLALDIAWAAGIFEGEGSVGFNNSSASAAVAQKDSWLCVKLQELFGGSINYYEGGNPPIRPCMYYRWQVHGSRARGFLMTIYAFLSPRRKGQIEKVLK